MKERLKRPIEYTPKTVNLLYSSPKKPEPCIDIEKSVLTLEIVRDRINEVMNQYTAFIGGTYAISPLQTLRKRDGRRVYKLMFVDNLGESKELATGTLQDIDKVILGYKLKDEELIGYNCKVL
jgi:hypothetical protein